MVEDFVRLASSDDVQNYQECFTFEEKLNSEFVQKMTKYTGVSVFKLSGITVERAVAAFTAKRRRPGSVSYTIFGEYVVLPEQTVGGTPDAKVNTRHYEFSNMSDSNLVDLADHMVNAGDSGTMDSRQIRDACRDSIDAVAILTHRTSTTTWVNGKLDTSY